MTDKQIAYQLLGVLQHYAPDAAAQKECTYRYKEAQKVNNERQLVRCMVNTLADGLNYGNWPWIIYGKQV